MHAIMGRCGARIWAGSLLLVLLLQSPAGAAVATAPRAMISTGHPIATEAGLRAFQRGGNAIDAALAAAFTLGVVDGHNSGIGGGCLMLIHLANGRILAIDGREVAPYRAQRDMYLRAGRADPRLSRTGALAIGVPGALAAYQRAAQFAVLPWREHFLGAANLAERGFVLDEAYGRLLADNAAELALFPASRQIFLRPDGSPLQAGELLRQPDLARTYRLIAENGIPWFYNGPFAVATAVWMGQNSGLISIADFQTYFAPIRDPLLTQYRGFTIAGFPPPSSGGVHVAQILNILQNFDLPQIAATNNAAATHIVAEAMKLAFADRAFWLGDADHVRVPRGLTFPRYGNTLARQIDPNQAASVIRHGVPPAAGNQFFRRHTTHFSTADAFGNWVACTATLNTSFGSKVVIPETGVLMNNQMDDFSIQPGVPNFFGLVGAEANAIGPRKRPLSSMSPTLVLRNRLPVLSIGAAGGPTIISQVVQALVHVIDFEMDISTALNQSRFHHQWRPDELRMENTTTPEVIEGLRQRGHNVVIMDPFGRTQAVYRPDVREPFVGVADPRTPTR